MMSVRWSRSCSLGEDKVVTSVPPTIVVAVLLFRFRVQSFYQEAAVSTSLLSLAPVFSDLRLPCSKATVPLLNPALCDLKALQPTAKLIILTEPCRYFSIAAVQRPWLACAGCIGCL